MRGLKSVLTTLLPNRSSSFVVSQPLGVCSTGNCSSRGGGTEPSGRGKQPPPNVTAQKGWRRKCKKRNRLPVLYTVNCVLQQRSQCCKLFNLSNCGWTSLWGLLGNHINPCLGHNVPDFCDDKQFTKGPEYSLGSEVLIRLKNNSEATLASPWVGQRKYSSSLA